MTATLGMTAPAFSVVLSTFMAGLGIGSFALAYVMKRGTSFFLHNIKSSLNGFALIQAGIGILGIAFPFFLHFIDSVYISIAPETDGIHHTLIRSIFTALLLLPITSLLGTGFPLLAGLSTALASKHSEQRPGRVYYVGVLASAAGALASLLIIPTWGLFATSLFLGTMNLVMASVAYLMGIRYAHDEFLPPTHPRSQTTQKRTPSRKPENSRVATDYPVRMILAIGSVIGFLILGLEIVGAQFIWLVINVTAYSEGLLFAVVLLAMALGSLVYLCARRYCSPVVLLTFGFLSAVGSQMTLIAFAGNIAASFDQLLHQSNWMQAWIGSSSLRFFLASGTLTFSVLGVPAIGYGLSFCCLCELTLLANPSASVQSLSASSGQSTAAPVSPLARLYAWHNGGSVVGVLITSFILIPWVGLTVSLIMLSGLGLVVLWMIFSSMPFSLSAKTQSSGQSQARSMATMGIWVVLLGSLLWIGINGDLTFRQRAAGASQEVLFQREEASGVVEVFTNRETGERTLLTSRLRQEGGSGEEDIRVQRLQGYLPLLLHPYPRRVLTIGLGTGIAAASNLRSEVEQLTIVEISDGIIEAAALFDQENHGILSNPKTRVVQQDGRNFMKLSRQRFDLIVQELFFPYQSGVGSLYTVEHYQQCRERLAIGGMIGQWITINQLGIEDLRVLIHTFQTVFPHTSLWLHGGYLLILGGLEPLTVDFWNYSHRFEESDVLGGIASLGTDSYDFLGRFITHGTPLEDWISDAPLNTDDNRLIEYSAPLSFTTLNTTALAATTLDALRSMLRPISDVIQEQSVSSEEQQVRLSHVSQAANLLLQGIVARTRGHDEHAEAFYTQAWQHNRTNYQIQTFLEPLWASRGRAFLLDGNLKEAERWLNKSLLVSTTNPNVFFDLGLLYSQQAHDREASNWYTQVLEKFPDWPERDRVVFNLGLTQYRMGNYSKSASLFQQVIQIDPRSSDGHFNLANSFAMLGDYRQAATHYQVVLRLVPNHKDAQSNLVEVITWMNATGNPKAS